MNRVSRLILILVLLAGLLPVGVVSVQAQAPSECAQVALSLGATYKEGNLKGSKFCVIYPPDVQWNKDLVVFAHGYVFDNPLNPAQPPEIPWDQAIRGDLNLPGILVKLGYAFAISSYHKDGLAVLEGVQGTAALVRNIKKTNKAVRRVFITGASEGGLVTTLALQQYPQLFAGGLSTCGPIGDFQGQVNYWGDFRSVFDALFPTVLKNPGVLPLPSSTAVYIPLPTRLEWMSSDTAYNGQQISLLKLSVLQALMGSSDSTKLLLGLTGAPTDPQDVQNTTAETALGLLDYNVQATDEGQIELGGNPYFNNGSVNGYPVDPYTADAAALKNIAANYQTSGKLSRQLVVMHDTGDPIVPFWHVKLFTKKVLQAGSIGKLAVIPVARYGHCNFTSAEAVFAFYTMVLRSTLIPFTMDQVKNALPDAAAQNEYLKLKDALK